MNEALGISIHVKGCVTVTWQGGEWDIEEGEEHNHPVNLYDQLFSYSSDGKPWTNGSLGTVTFW